MLYGEGDNELLEEVKIGFYFLASFDKVRIFYIILFLYAWIGWLYVGYIFKIIN
jgi:hypothetical protein